MTPISPYSPPSITKSQLCYLIFVSITRQIHQTSEATRNGSVQVQNDTCSWFEHHKETYPLFRAAVSRKCSVTSCFGVLQNVCPSVRSVLFKSINILKPTGHVMHQQFNIQQLYALPTPYLCVLCLSENKQRLVSLTA